MGISVTFTPSPTKNVNMISAEDVFWKITTANKQPHSCLLTPLPAMTACSLLMVQETQHLLAWTWLKMIFQILLSCGENITHLFNEMSK